MSSPLVLTNLDRAARENLHDRGPVPMPLGEIVSRLSVLPLADDEGSGRRIGIWECTPGRWPRQQMAAEFAIILSGRCSFTPTDGTEIAIGPGDVVSFPANTTGTWDVTETVRKIYLLVS